MNKTVKPKSNQTKSADAVIGRIYPWTLIVSGVMGLVASFTLTLEKFAVLQNPNHTPACDLSPLLSCGSVINTDQASAFGFSNPLLGILGFGAVLFVGVSLLAGMSNLKRWYWRTFWFGNLFGVVFIHWLAWQSVYNIGALCPYCMVAWVATMISFWYTTLWCWRQKYLPVPKILQRAHPSLQSNHVGVLIIWAALITALIVVNFRFYFGF